MADQTQCQTNPENSIDPNSGFCPQTKIFHSLRSPVPLPPPSQPLSITDYALSLLHATASATTVLIDSATDHHVPYSLFLRQIKSLASSLKSQIPISKGHVAFILSPASVHIPVLYLSLLSLGIIISPANPLSSHSEVNHLVQLSKPVIAFATSSTAHKIPELQFGTILLDSPQFLSMINGRGESDDRTVDRFEIDQSDTAAILYSSGTTGRVKGVLLSHRNFIALIGGIYHLRHTYDPNGNESHLVHLFPLPLFHVFGFFMLVSIIAAGETMVLMQRFDFEAMLKAVEKYRITNMPVSPPLVVALAKLELVKKYDLSSLQVLGSGGAPLGKEVVDSFKVRFPKVDIGQGYGLTESAGAATRMIGSDEAKRVDSVGRLSEDLEAKIVDTVTGEALPPGHKGELWLRGPIIMKGYIGDDKATAETLDSEGWLKTGDLCYFDSEGFLYIVDRLKELIKYKAYQVAPAELERILLSNFEIADAAVIPYPNEEAGEIPMAFIVRKPGRNITAAQVMDFVAKQGYGLTESGGGATRMIGPDESKRHGSVGRLAENMEAKIVDPGTGEALPPDHKGELWLRGPTIMKGYVGDDKATAETLDPEGWLKTGDLCYFDSDGFLYIVDRLKELIKYKAYQVPPAELEHILHSNPEVADAAVIPYPDKEAGEIPMAFVVRKPGSTITAAKLMDFVAKQVAPYKKIRRVAFVNSIPKSPAGKILRRELVKYALSSSASKL